MYEQWPRTSKDIEKDSPCIGVCMLNENKICIGCDRHIDEIVQRGRNNEK